MACYRYAQRIKQRSQHFTLTVRVHCYKVERYINVRLLWYIVMKGLDGLHKIWVHCPKMFCSSRNRNEKTKTITEIPYPWFTDHTVEILKKKVNLKNCTTFDFYSRHFWKVDISFQMSYPVALWLSGWLNSPKYGSFEGSVPSLFTLGLFLYTISITYHKVFYFDYI